MIKPVARSFSYHRELDGVRAVAMVAIVFFHAGAAGWDHAFISLDLFFVLSGFLVAHVVLGEIEETGEFRLSRFYARRVRRLLPAAVVAIVATCVLWLLLMPQTERVELVRHAQAALVWMANWQMVAESRDYFAADIHSSPFLHYWSLSVEEQYYILFPLVVLACARFMPGRRPLLVVLGLLFAASITSQVVTGIVDPNRAYFATDTRAFQILAGALAALAVREFARSGTGPGEADWPVAGRVLAATGAVGYLLLGTELIAMSNSARSVVATPLAVALVVGMFAAPRSVVTRVMSAPVLVYLGSITYGTYLWHWPAVLLIGEFTTVRPSVVATLALLLATALASLSSELLERPIRRARWLNRFGWSVVASGVAVSVATAAVVVGPVLRVDRTPSVLLADSASDRVADLEQSESLERAFDRSAEGLDLVAAKAGRGPQRSCTSQHPEDCLVVEGDGPHVVLVGDSHARMYGDAFAALAREHGFQLSMSVAPGCPFQDGVTVTRNGGERPACAKARDGFYETTLPAMEPDLVIFASAAKSEKGWHGTVVGPDGSTDDPARILSRTTRATVAKVRDTGAAVLFLETAMGTEGWGEDGFDPLDCLATAETLRDCAVTQPTDRPAEDAIYRALALDADDVATVDPTPVYCPDAPACLPVLNRLPVWRNADHLNSALLERRRDKLWRRIEATGLLQTGG